MKHPMVGRMGQVEGTRELIVHKSYRRVYEIVDDTFVMGTRTT